MDIDYFLKINNTYGTTNDKDVQLYNLKNQVNDRFTDTIDYYKVKINKVDRDALIVRTIKTDEKTIKSRAGETFEMGDYVEFENNTWLVIAKDMCNQVYTSGTLKLCNYTLKFQSPDGTILSYPCITSNTTSANGNDENKVISLGANKKSILLPYDEHTSTLATDRRLYVDKRTKPTPYMITGDPDTTTYNYGGKGLIYIMVEQRVKQETNDRPDLGICDYFEPTVTPLPPVGDFSMDISASGSLVIGGVTRTFTPKLVNSDGVEQTFTAVWTFNYNGMTETDFTKTYNGNKCYIKVAYDEDIVDNQLILTCTSDDGLYSASYKATIKM